MAGSGWPGTKSNLCCGWAATDPASDGHRRDAYATFGVTFIHPTWPGVGVASNPPPETRHSPRATVAHSAPRDPANPQIFSAITNFFVALPAGDSLVSKLRAAYGWT